MLRILEDLAEPVEDRGEAERPLLQPSISTLDIKSDCLLILYLSVSIFLSRVMHTLSLSVFFIFISILFENDRRTSCQLS